MKPIHLVTAQGKNKEKPERNYIQVKAGYVYATNGYIAIKAPVNEVFGTIDKDPLIKESEELYFLFFRLEECKI